MFRYNPPGEFGAKYLLERLFEFMPDSLSMPIAPTREFWMHVLEHGDFGIHNTTIAVQPSGEPLVTSLYDWETACV